ncbi:MAG: glycosyltransferase family 2 protein [Oscillospiraceae bacterium]|nr:glycosyltransferase family 2 protein [Oscillospiraceae bacterium]
MINEQDNNVTRVYSNEQDTVFKAIKRNVNFGRIKNLTARGYNCLKTRGLEATFREVAFRVCLMTKQEVWQFRADVPLHREWKAQRKEVFEKMPKISIVVPLYNTPDIFLQQMIKSCLNQSYVNLELVLADASDKEQNRIEKTVLRLNDGRIVYKKLAQNVGIAENTNEGFAIATGEYLALLDHDDTLQLNALYEVVKAINEQKADFIYSDEIILNSDMRKLCEYHFKPDFSPDTLRGCNYITHLSVFSRTLLEKAGGGERGAFNGSQDFDLILRLTEQAQHIYHIPKVLYFWRSHASSTASDIGAKPYAILAGAKAVQTQLDRLGLKGTAQPIEGKPGAYYVRYEIVGNPLVSVIIPNKDHTDDLDRLLHSFYEKAGYENFEIIVVENNSTHAATFAYYEKAKAEFKNLQVVHYKGDFNFSAICNFGVQSAKGEHILLLNNDIEILSQDFLRELLSYSQRKDVGAVGAKLYYPDDKIQHGGVFIGIGGTAGHSHKGHPRTSGGDMYRLATTQNFLAVTGACLLVKTSLYKQLNGLDEENFAVAFNDVDFCLRLYEAGYLNVFTPFADAYHYESKSRGYDNVGSNAVRFEKEKAAYLAKYAKILAAGDPYYNPHFTLKYENYGYV